jgi:hypothetical protein
MQDVGPESLQAGVMRYFSPRPAVHLRAKAARHATKVVSGLIEAASLHLADLSEAARSFQGRTGFGSPVCSSDPSYFETVLGMSVRHLESPKYDALTAYPYILGSRGFPRGYFQPAKRRVVFQGSRVIANLEKMVQIPVMEALRHCGSFEAWNGRASVDFAITEMFEMRDTSYLSLDFSNFDASVPQSVVEVVFGIIGKWFNRTYVSQIIGMLQHAFQFGGIYTPFGYFGGRTGGIPSGSGLTNLIGSMVNLWVMHYAAYTCGYSIVAQQVQGDDGVYAFKGGCDPSKVADVLLQDLGMVLSADKAFHAENEVHFLQNVHRRSYVRRGLCVGVRPIMRVLNGMMSYERFRTGWNGRMDSIRWIQQMENASDHPVFGAFVRWLWGFDAGKQYLRDDLATLIQKAGGQEKVERLLGGSVGYSKTPINHLFAGQTVQVLSRLNRFPLLG